MACAPALSSWRRSRGEGFREAGISRRRVLNGLAVLVVGCAAPDLPPASHARPARPAEPAATAPDPVEAKGATSEEPASPPPPAREDENVLEAHYRRDRALAVYRGEATYYGNSFSGRRTASGEAFDPRAFTAAHRTLPFGSIVRVVCPKSRKTVYVRINDRGPFGNRRRIIDLSRAAAERLDIVRLGVADVRVEVVELGKRRHSPRGKRQ
jgi:rare lipoprotein A